MLPRIFIDFSPGYSTELSFLDTILHDVEYERVEKEEDGPFDILLYFTNEASNDNLCHWINVVNRSKIDILIFEADDFSTVWSDYQMSKTTLMNNAAAKELLRDIVLDKVTDRSRFPNVVIAEDSSSSKFIAMTDQKLVDLLANSENRVIGLSLELKNAITTSSCTSRVQYDLARFIKGTSRRYESSVVEINVEFAGGEASSSPNIFFQTISEIVFDQRSSNLITLRGAPGSGKSVHLKQLDVELALQSIRNSEEASSVPMAFCVNLGEHAEDASEQETPFDWLEKKWGMRFDKNSNESLQNFNTILRQQQVVFLLDGFNEIPFETASERRSWMNKWKSCIHQILLQNPKTRVVVACRQRDLVVSMGNDEVIATNTTVLSLKKQNIMEIARKRNINAYSRLMDAFSADLSLVRLYKVPSALNDYLDANVSEVPTSRSEIFWKRIYSLLKREFDLGASEIRPDWLPHNALNNFLSATSLRDAVATMKNIPLLSGLGLLAVRLASMGSLGGKQRAAIASEEFTDWLNSEGALPKAADKSEFRSLSEDLSFLEENEGFIKFSHHTLQDFFCVLGLKTGDLIEKIKLEGDDFENLLQPLIDALADIGIGDTLQLIPSTGFEETFSLLREIDLEADEKAMDSNPWLVSEMSVIEGEPVDLDLQKSLLQRLQTAFLGSNDVRLAISCLSSMGNIIGHLDDYDSHKIPELVQIPDGTWKMGLGDQNMERYQLQNASRDLSTHDLPAFKIGKYPVTNLQFQSFIASDGYQNQSYWSTEGWHWRNGTLPVQRIYERWITRRDMVSGDHEKPFRLLDENKISILEAAAIIRFSRMSDDEIASIATSIAQEKVNSPAYWQFEKYRNPLQPVVGVSFHEAKAYCNWLSEAMGASFRLPTENEWDAAALYSLRSKESIPTSMNNLDFSVDWTPIWGNVAELHIGAPTPVGSFEDQANNSGVPLDMRGNVFEWISDLVDPDDEWCFVVKGGSFRHLVRRAHPAYRGRGDNTSRNDDNGFRIVCDA